MERNLDFYITNMRAIAADLEKDPQTREDFDRVAKWLEELKGRRERGEPGVSEWLPTGKDPRKGRCKHCRGRSFRSFKYCPDCGCLMIKGRQ